MAQSTVLIGEAYGPAYNVYGEQEPAGDQIRSNDVRYKDHYEVQTAIWKKRTSGSGKWTELIRCKSKTLGENAAGIMVKLINSGLVGYDQHNRNSLFKELEKNKWSVDRYIQSGIKTETDCSALAYASYCVFLPELRKYLDEKSNSPTTANIARKFKAYGLSHIDIPSIVSKGEELFTIIKNSSEINTDKNLQIGDLLNDPGYHVVMVVSLDGDIPKVDTSMFQVERSDYTGQLPVKEFPVAAESTGHSPIYVPTSIVGAGGEQTHMGGGTYRLGTTIYRR